MPKENNSLTRSLKNAKNNKDLLRLEINHATDPQVRLELTKLLLDLENKDKKRRRQRWSLLFLFVVTVISFLIYLGSQPTPAPKTSNSLESPTTPSSEKELEPLTMESSKSETNLSAAELEKWVMSILDLLPPPPTRYILNVNVDETDNLAYIRVGIDQLDSLGTFRVNAQGELEVNGPITGVMGRANWTLISEKYLDTTFATQYFKEREAEHQKKIYWIESTKQLLISKKFSITPILYDGEDVAKAIDNNKAPQNLIDDGVREIEFIDESTIRVELVGTYRRDFDDTYSLNDSVLIIRENYIPYTVNNGIVSFDTWTTESDGHTITWNMH